MNGFMLLQASESVLIKSAEMAERDPHGAIITIVSVSVVFCSLIILYYAYTFIGKILSGELKLTLPKKEKKAAVPEDVVCDLLPVPIVIDEYFADKRDLILAAEELLAQNEAKLSELTEEYAESYFDEDNFADSKVSDTNIKKRIKALDKKTDSEEIAVLQQYLDLKGDISLNKKVIKERKYDLLTALVVKYADLSGEDIKRLVIEKKWFATLSAQLDSEMQRISQQLTSKVSALAERYAQTLPEIDAEIADLEAKVAEHLRQMGY